MAGYEKITVTRADLEARLREYLDKNYRITQVVDPSQDKHGVIVKNIRWQAPTIPIAEALEAVDSGSPRFVRVCPNEPPVTSEGYVPSRDPIVELHVQPTIVSSQMNENRVIEIKNELLDETGLQGVEHVQVAAESQAERLAKLEDQTNRGVREIGSIRTPRFEVREYPHPGKYEGGLVIDMFLDNSDFFDDTAGDVSENGRHVGIVRGPFSSADLDKATVDDEFGPLTDSEKAFLTAIKGALVSTDSQGFVNVSYALIDAEMQEIERDFDSVGQDNDQESFDDEEFGDPGISHDDYPSKDLPRQEY